jgi:hypothetical protein
MIYLLIAILGLALFFGARYLAHTVKHREPRLSRIEPAIPVLCSAGMMAGLLICVTGLVTAVWVMVG